MAGTTRSIIEGRLDSGDLRGILDLMDDIVKGSDTIMYRSINKALTGTRTDATNEIYKKLNLTKTRIRKDFAPISKASKGNLTGKIESSGEPVGLYSFGAKQLKSGIVSVKVLRAGSKKKIKHAFIATANNATNVFWRETIYKKPIIPGLQYAKLPKKYRLPIERLTGPRIQDIYADREVFERVQESGWDRYSKEMLRLIDLELDRHR